MDGPGSLGRQMAPEAPYFDWFVPRQVNGQVVILCDVVGTTAAGSAEANADAAHQGRRPLRVLLQLRSPAMAVMPGHIAAIGGTRSKQDPDSRTTALREVIEETGLVSGVEMPPSLFAQGERCDWYVMKLRRPAFRPAQHKWECGDMQAVLSHMPVSTVLAECFGHAWVDVDEVDRILLPLMGGLLGRIRSAVRHLRIIEANRIGGRAEEAPPLALPVTDLLLNMGGNSDCPQLLTQGFGEEGEGEPGGVPPFIGSLQTQLEYYLSDQNLCRDKFFHNKISSEPDGWLPMELVMGCRKVQAFGATPAHVVLAVQQSDTIEAREDGLAIRRAGNRPLPALEAPNSKSKGQGRGNGRGGGQAGPNQARASPASSCAAVGDALAAGRWAGQVPAPAGFDGYWGVGGMPADEGLAASGCAEQRPGPAGDDFDSYPTAGGVHVAAGGHPDAVHMRTMVAKVLASMGVE